MDNKSNVLVKDENNNKRDCDFTNELVCPYCGATNTDSWEINANDGEQYCYDCYNTFFWERNISITYSSSKE